MKKKKKFNSKHPREPKRIDTYRVRHMVWKMLIWSKALDVLLGWFSKFQMIRPKSLSGKDLTFHFSQINKIFWLWKVSYAIYNKILFATDFTFSSENKIQYFNLERRRYNFIIFWLKLVIKSLTASFQRLHLLFLNL